MSNDHDPFDPDLADALRSRARGSAAMSVDAAHDAVLRRASGVRRRRAAVAGGGLLAVAVVGIALIPRGDDGSDRVAPADSPGVEVSGDDTGSSGSSSSSSTSSSTSVSPTTVDLGVPTVPTATSPATSEPAQAESTVPGAPSVTTVPRGAGSTSSSSSSTSSPSTTSTLATSTTVAEPAPSPFTRTYQSGGGSITVSFDGTRLSLDSVAAADGHEAEIEDDSADRVRVRFTGPNESRIEVRVDDGELRERIDG